jgi:hypothetical protein
VNRRDHNGCPMRYSKLTNKSSVYMTWYIALVKLAQTTVPSAYSTLAAATLMN